MSAVVQATCPGCKKVLRIPADWLQQAFRCKHCRTVIQARPGPPGAYATGLAGGERPAPTPPGRQSPGEPGGVSPGRPARPAAYQAPPPLPVAPLVAAPAPLPIAGPVAEPGSAFVGFDESDPGSHRYRRRRRSGGRGWIAFVVGLVLVALTGATGFVFRDDLKTIFEGKQAAKKEEKKDDKDKQIASTKKDGKRPGEDPDPTKRPDGTKPKDPPKDPKTPPKDPSKEPVKTPPKDPVKTPPKDPPKDPPIKRPPAGNVAFPRRALVISVHNYLYANPVSFGDPNPQGRNFHTFVGRLPQRSGFRIAPQQVAHLSDAAPGEPTAPVKEVIENTLVDFLKQSRPQDRLLVLFAGHGVEIKGEAYLVPLEGELNNAKTLIPLKWVYQQFQQCKARQKVLVVDVCRFNPGRGAERPTEGPMSQKFDLALKSPPKGVQVWTACVEGQQSYEFEDVRVVNGLFMDALYDTADRGVQGVIQKPNEPFPLKQMVEMVNARMREELEPLKLTQTSRLSGEEAEGGAEFDPDAPLPPRPIVAKPDVKNVAEERLVKGILKELNVPPVKKSQTEGLLHYEALPPFRAEALAAYPVDNTPTPLREAIERAQALLWALSANEPPPELAAATNRIKQSGELKTDLVSLPESFRAPAEGNAEMQFKNTLLALERRVASVIRLLEEELENMAKVEPQRKKAPKRWQANYDFMLARLQTQLVHVYEYQSALGSARKELPRRDPAVHNGWRLASTDKPRGDATGRKLAREVEKLLDKIAKEHADTPWEVLAKREKLTGLGLEWKPEK